MSLLWIPVTLLAASLQTARNLTQRSLIEAIGVVGATQVRFLYGFPFSLIFLLGVCLVVGQAPPAADARFIALTAWGSLTQIAATGLMLAAMRERSFAVTTAYIKTEPVQVAIFGALLLGDTLTPAMFLCVLLATAGVLLVSAKPGQKFFGAGARATGLGLAAGACFALSAIGYRAAILSLPEGGFVMRATTTLAWGLAISTLVLASYMLIADRGALIASLRAWRKSLFAGFLGAAASQFWFIGFALTTAGADRLPPYLRRGHEPAGTDRDDDDRRRRRRPALGRPLTICAPAHGGNASLPACAAALRRAITLLTRSRSREKTPCALPSSVGPTHRSASRTPRASRASWSG